MEFGDAAYIIVKGFIDAKTDHDRNTYGSFVALASRHDVKFISTCFSNTEISKEKTWDELIKIHDTRENSLARSSADSNNEETLYDFLNANSVLNTLVKNHNIKAAEQAISRFCLDDLGLRAVSFVEFTDASSRDLTFFASRAPKEAPPEPSGDAETAGSGSEVNGPEIASAKPGGVDEVFVRCEPLLDPVVGVAMNELKIGDSVFAKLPADSVFYKLLARNKGAFDGVVTSTVTGILVNELGTATISVKLSENVSGVMKLSGKVRIRVAGIGDGDGGSGGSRRSAPFSFYRIAPETVMGLGVVVLLAVALIAAIYIIGAE